MCITFVTGPQEANPGNEDKLKAGKAMDKIILSLAWKVEDLKKLSEIGREILRKIDAIVEDAGGDAADCVWPIFRFNLITALQEKLVDLGTGVTRYRRQPASHLFVMMITFEVRNSKPYKLPIQAIPHAGLKEADLRRFVNSITQEMVNRGMRLAGDVWWALCWCECSTNS